MMGVFAGQKIVFRGCLIAFGEPRAKQSQGEKPHQQVRFSRTTSVDYSLRSHLSLRSRQGMKVSLARPLLARLPSPRPSPLGLSGSGVRFDGTHLVARRPETRPTFAPDVDQPAKAARRYHTNAGNANRLREAA